MAAARNTRLPTKPSETAPLLDAAPPVETVEPVAEVVAETPPEVDVATVEQQLEEIATEIEVIDKTAGRMIGDRLIEARALHAYKRGDGFKDWVRTRLGKSPEWAYEKITVAEARKGALGRTLSDLPDKVLLEATRSTTPQEVRDEIERRLAAGEIVTAAEVRRLRDELRAAQARAEEADDLVAAAERSRRAAEARAQAIESTADKAADAVREEQRRVYDQRLADLQQKLREASARADAASRAPASPPIPTPANDVAFPGENVITLQQPAEEYDDDNEDETELADLANPRNRTLVVWGALNEMSDIQITGKEFWQNVRGVDPNIVKWAGHTLKILSDIIKEYPNVEPRL